MFIAADSMSHDLPEDVRALTAAPVVPPGDTIDRGETQSGVQAEALHAPPMGGAQLDRWNVQSHQYTSQVDVNASILARLISGKAEVSHHGVVQEAKRFCIRISETNRPVEFGTAVRLLVAVLGTEFEASLTLPNIAATAQLSGLRARIALSVDGYVGPLGELLPAPDNLNVENLVVYTDAFKVIQARVFGAEGIDHIAPTLLGYNSEDDPAE